MSATFPLRAAVTEFHETYGHPVRETPTLEVPTEELDLSFQLIAEEFGELAVAVNEGDLIEAADALGDLLWVVESMAVRLGIDTNRVLREIRQSNATKLGADGKPVLNVETGKIMKGPNYEPPNIERALDLGHIYPEDTEVDAQLDVIIAPSGGTAQMYIPTDYPQLAALRVVTPLSVSRLDSFSIRNAYVMKGVLVGHDWDVLEKKIRSAQAELGGQMYALDC